MYWYTFYISAMDLFPWLVNGPVKELQTKLISYSEPIYLKVSLYKKYFFTYASSYVSYLKCTRLHAITLNIAWRLAKLSTCKEFIRATLEIHR